MKCNKCGYDWSNSGDSAHVCGPVKVKQQEQGEPVAIIHRNEYNEYRLEPHDSFDIKSIPFNVDVPLFKSPQQPLIDKSAAKRIATVVRPWVRLTDEDKKQIAKEANYNWEMTTGEYAERIGRLTESKLREKNT